MDSSPAVVNGVVYIGSFDGNLYAIGTPTIPEFTRYLIPPLFMMTTLLAVIICRRKLVISKEW